MMENFQQLLIQRRSYRKFTDASIAAEQVTTLLQAALLSPTSKSSLSWQFVAIEDKEVLNHLSYCKENGAKFLGGASLAIVVCGEGSRSDVWIEDCSIAAINIQLQAEDLGIGSCWIQVRNRYTENGQSSEDFVRAVCGIGEELNILCIIALGNKVEPRKENDLSKLPWEKVHTL